MFVSENSIGKARSAYSDLCARWIGDDVANAERPQHQRLFQVLFAAPVFGAVSLAAGTLAGLSSAAFFVTAMLLMSLASFSVFIMARNSALGVVLGLWLTVISVLAAAASAILGPALVLPLSLIAAGEAWYVSRKPVQTLCAALAVSSAAFLYAAAAGNGEAGLAPAVLAVTVTLAHALTLLARRWAGPEAAVQSVPVSADTQILDAERAVRVGMMLTGEVFAVAGDCSSTLGISPKRLEGFGLYERVLVADRLHYLSALDEIRTGKDTISLRVRLRNDAADSAFLPVDLLFCRTADEKLALSIRSAPADVAPAQMRVQDLGWPKEGEIKADRYLASVSHELRTPLNAILGFSDILKQEMFGPLANDRQREYVGLIHESGSHLLSVVNMILDMSKIDMGAYQIIAEPFDVAEAASMSIAMVKEQAAKKHIQIETEFDAKAAECTGDRRAVQQILINLLSNAVKFTPDGGKVCLTSQEEGGYLVLRVSDTGIGISAEDLDRIGQPFFQVQNDYTRTFEGTGLGLSLVRGLVELHAGGLSVESEPGAGTDVIVRLPIAGPGKARRPDMFRIGQRSGATAADEPKISASTSQGAAHDPAIRKTA